MKLKRLILTCLILSLFGITPRSSAQDGYPKTLNPADVLAEGVELVQRKPVINMDNDAELVWSSDGTTWTTHPYPPDFPGGIFFWHQRSDGNLLLSTSEVFAFYEDYWLYDPRSGTFSRPEEACGIFKALPGEGRWGFYRESDDKPYRLCFTETGQFSEPLPAELQPNLCGDIRDLTSDQPEGLSPDGKWLVFSDCKDSRSFYSYEPATGKINPLGTNMYSYGELAEIVRWADNTHPLILNHPRFESGNLTLFVVDVTKSNSLQMLVSDASDSPLYFDNPPRYEWVPAELRRAELVPGFGGPPGDGGDNGDSCGRHLFDLRTLTLTVQKPFPDNCGMGVAVGDGTGDRLYRNVHDDDPGLATLMRFNFETGASRKLLTSEIVKVESVSPGGQYAQLLLAQEKNIQFPPESVNLKSPGLSILNLQTGQVIFETPLEKVGNQWTHLTPGFRWVDGSSFILIDSEDETAETYRLVQLTGKEYTRRAISPSEFLLLSNPVPAIVWTPDNSGNKFAALVDPVRGRISPVTRVLDPKQYEVKVYLRKNRLIEVIIEDAQRLGGMYYGNFTLHHWLVQVPGFSYF